MSNQNHTAHPEQAPLAFLVGGGGEMGERVRTFDWSATPLGPVGGWPQSLKIAVRIMLGSRYAMWLGWGPEFTFLYNDAYAAMTLGHKHPRALGRPASDVWPEIWAEVGPRAEKVIATGEATWDERLLLFLERRGFPEESYHTFSYSPIPGDAGGVGGMLCVVTEDTERTIGERRLRTLRELAARTTEEAKSVEDACQTAARTLAENPHDLPFVLIYLLDDAAATARLVGATGLPDGSPAAPPSVGVADGGDGGWPLRAVLGSGRAEVVTELGRRFGPLACGPYPEPPAQAVVVPMAKPGQPRPAGFVVAGVSPRLVLADEYKGFLELVAGNIATAVGNARAYEEERRRAEALAELDRAKTAFFSNVSHEFRTPLTLMLGPVEELLARSHTDLPPAAAGQLEVVNRNGLRLLRLVNSLLDFSRIEAGRVRAVYQPTDLAAFTADLASNFRSACERAGVRLVVDCPPLGGPAFVDREMWEKVVLNLVSNAFKFTFDGEIAVTLRRAADAAELRVRDTGTGVPAEEMPRLFERFHRVENARGRTHEGSGIGLALVQELVKLHGGTVTAESVVGQGTTFIVTVPLGKAHLTADQIGDGRTAATTGTGASPYVEEALRWLPDEGQHDDRPELPTYHEPLPTPHRHNGEAGGDDRPRVLVADDNADMRQYVVRLLAEQFRVEAVPDGEAALAAVREQPPELVLTDVMMPKLTGFGLLKELRADHRTRSLPVIMLSARAGEESRVEGVEAGADDYLVKPFSARELLARVTAHVQMARLRREATEAVRRRETFIGGVLGSITDGFYAVDGGWRFTFVNDEIVRRFGRPREAVIGQHIWEMFAAAVGNDAYVGLHRAMADRVVVEYEVFYEPWQRWFLDKAFPTDDGGLAVYTRDITDRKRQEKEREASRQTLHSLVERCPFGIYIVDADFRIASVNAGSQDKAFANVRPLIGRPFDEAMRVIWPEPVAAANIDIFRHTLATGEPYYSQDFISPRADIGQTEGYEWELHRVTMPDGRPGVVCYYYDSTKLRQAERQVREAEGRFRTMADTAPALIWQTDDGGVTFVNRHYLDFFGQPFAAITGMGWADFLHPDDAAGYTAAYLSAFTQRKAYSYQCRFRRRDGAYRWLHNIGTPHHVPDGTFAGFIGCSVDVTDIKEAEEALVESDRQKDEFLATLAHELRNPLAPLRNGLQVMKLAAGDGRAVERSRAMMERQVEQMAHLIDDLMDLSRISRGKIVLQKTRLPISTPVRTAVDTSRPLIDQQGHTLTVDVPDEPVYVDADNTRLTQVFANLLNNAAKYTDRGGDIRLSVVRQGGQVVVTVADTGVGIPAHMLPRVFDMFSQVDRSLEKAQGGLGIGLNIVKRLVEMHGGTITAESGGHGMGSTFTVRLPVVLAVTTDRRDGEAGSPPKPAARRRILVADDNADGAISLAEMLDLMGNETQTAHDGLEAVALAGVFKPDVILMDIGMPRLNGYDACRRIREQPGSNGVVLVACTGWGQEEDKKRSQDAGFDLHMVKPVDPAALEKLLAGLRATTG